VQEAAEQPETLPKAIIKVHQSLEFCRPWTNLEETIKDMMAECG
jgi:hypothetical protein